MPFVYRNYSNLLVYCIPVDVSQSRLLDEVSLGAIVTDIWIPMFLISIFGPDFYLPPYRSPVKSLRNVRCYAYSTYREER